jgi:sulfite exporter TauE/SafE
VTVTPDNLTLPLVFGAGMLGSSHCLGMCGAISASMSAGTRSMRESVFRQLSWSIGRTFTYVFLGLAVAATGQRLIGAGSRTSDLQAWLAIFAGVLMVGQGLHTVGWIRFPTIKRSHASCTGSSVLKQLLQGGSATGAFVAGLVTGFLPCGLVYSFLLLSASTGSVGQGILIMFCFGAGTIPVMLATGAGWSLISWTSRRRMLHLASWCVLLAGVATLSRGVVFAVAANPTAPEACPMCASEEEEEAMPDKATGSELTSELVE